MWHISKYWAGVVAFILLLLPISHVIADEINIAVARGPVILDPRFATDAASVRLLRLIAPGIVTLDKNFEPTSKYLSYFGHRKYQKFFMEVGSKVTFSDGSKLTVQDIKSYYESILKVENKSPLKGAFADVESLTIENNDRLIITLSKPNPFFWGALETSMVKLTGNEAENPIGLGIYKLAKLDDFGNTILNRLDGGQVLNFNVIKDPVVRYLKLARGDIDIIHNDISEEILQYGKKEGFVIHEAPSNSYSYMGFLMSSGKTSDPKVRQALSLALDKNRIIRDLLGGRAKPAYSLLNKKHPDAYKSKIIAYNPEKAEKLLDEAGYEKDDKGKRFTLRLAITSNSFIQRLAQVIQQDFKEIGVDVDISSSEWGTFYGNIKKGNFESYILTWVGRFQSDIYKSIFHSDMMPPNGANRGQYKNDKMDNLLNELMKETEDKQRQKLSHQVQKLQEADTIYLPLWKRSHVALTSKNIEGYEINPDGGYEGLFNTYLKP